MQCFVGQLVDIDGVGLDGLWYGGGRCWLGGVGPGVARAANLDCRRRSLSFTMSRCVQTVSKSGAFTSHGGKEDVEGSVVWEGAKASMVTNNARGRRVGSCRSTDAHCRGLGRGCSDRGRGNG